MKHTELAVLAILVLGMLGSVSAAEKDFSFAVLPDSQYYPESNPEIFTNQTKWIVENEQEEKIEYVAHLGDIVQHYDNSTQLNRANKSMWYLKNNSIPHGVVAGNHDMGVWDDSVEDWTYYEEYWGEDRFNDSSWYGGTPNNNRDHYDLIEAGGEEFIIMSFSFRDDKNNLPLEWANNTLQEHSDRKAIITAHCHKSDTGVLECQDFDNDGDPADQGTEFLKLAEWNENVFMITAGHHHGEYYEDSTDEYNDGQFLHEITTSFQERSNGGNGWLRMYNFYVEEDRVEAETYSPYLDQYETDSDSNFNMTVEMESSNYKDGGIIGDCPSTPFCTDYSSYDQPAVFQNMVDGDSIWNTWSVNATGESGDYDVWVFANSSNPNVDRADSSNVTVSITDTSKGGIIPNTETAGEPFFIQSGDSNPQIQSGSFGTSSNLWFSSMVEASGGEGSYDVFFIANSTNPNVGQVESGRQTVTIGSSSGVSVNIDSPVQGQTYNTDSVDLNVTSSEPIDTWEYSLDGGSNQSFTPNTTITGLSDGSHTVDVYATDSNGNTGSESVSFTVDANNVPSASFTRNDSTPEVNETVGFDASGSSDSDGSISSYEWDWDGDDSYEGSGVSPSHTFSETGDFSVKLRVTDNEGATDSVSNYVNVSINTSSTVYSIFQDDSKSSNSDNQYLARHKQKKNLGNGYLSNISISSPSIDGTCSNCNTRYSSFNGLEAKNFTYNSSGDWITDEDNGSLDNASSLVKYGKDFDVNYSAFQNISVKNSRSDISLTFDASPAIPNTNQCHVTNSTEVTVSASTTKEFDFNKSCDPGDETDYTLTNIVNNNSEIYEYNGTVEVYSNRTDEVKQEYWIKIEQGRLNEFDSRNKSSVNFSIDNKTDGLFVREETKNNNDYLVMKALTNRTQSSIHEGTHYFFYEYRVDDSSSSSGGGGGGGSSGSTTVTESPHDWSVTLIDSEFVGVFKPELRPGESFEREVLIRSNESDLSIDISCESENSGACSWVDSDIDKVNFDTEGETIVTIRGQVPENISKETFRFKFLFTDPSYEEGSDVGVNTVNFVVSKDSRFDFLFGFIDNLTGFYAGVPIILIGFVSSLMFLLPTWALGKLEKYPKIVPSVSFVIFVVVVGML